MAPQARLGVASTGLVAEGYRGGVGSESARSASGSSARARGGVGGAAQRARAWARPRKLTAEQRAQIPALLARGAEAYGFAGDVWTASRVAEVIERTFGVRYHARSCQSAAAPGGLEPAAADPAGHPARRGRRSRAGTRSAGPPSKKSERRRIYHRLGRRIRLLSAAARGADVGATRGRRRCCASS